MATMVIIANEAAKNRVPSPITSAMAPISSNQVDNGQLKSTGARLNGNGKRSAISANQFSPRYFSSPDSKNSQPSNTRRLNSPIQ